ncbi:MAG TPA: glycosyltransferase family 39 protein [Blastocatellia bacterium]|nr:glycosyltransferase family 39 protein [Blastocatellia bacterium]
MKKTIALQRAAGKLEKGSSLSLPYPVYLSLALAVMIAAIYAHIQVAQAGLDYTGPLGVLDRVFDLLLAVALIAAAFCVGRATSRLLRVDYNNVAEEISVSIMLGTGITGLAVLGIGLAGMLKPIPVAALVVVLVAASHREAARLRDALRAIRREAGASGPSRLLALSFVVIVVLLAIRVAAPPHNYDEAIYHLSVTKLFVAEGRVYPVHDNWAGNMPFLIQMIYAICLIAKADIAAKLVSLGLALVTATGLYGFSVRFLSRRVGVIALFGFFGAGLVVEVAVTTRVDLSLAGMIFLSTYAMMVFLDTGERGWLYVSAILSGFCLGIKYTAGVWLAMLVVMLVFEGLYKKRERFLVVLKHAFLYGAVAALLASPWLIKSLVWYHNPVYPFVTGEAAEFTEAGPRYFNLDDERRLDAHFDVARREMPAVVAQIDRELASEAASREVRNPLRFWEYFTRPDAYNPHSEPYQDPNYLFVVVPFLFILRKPKWLAWLTLISVVFFVFVASTIWVGRMLLPLYPALTLVAAYVMTELATRLKPHAAMAEKLPGLLVAVTVCSTLFVSSVQVYKAGGLSFIAGSLSRRDFMEAAFYYPPINFVNTQTPSDARVMMIGAQMCYDMERDYIADVNWTTTEWRRLLARNSTLDEAHEDLKRRGVTHILYSPGLFKFAARMGRSDLPDISQTASSSGPEYRQQLRNWSTFELYSRRFLEPIYSYHDYQVFRLK